MSTTPSLDSNALSYPFLEDADRYPWIPMNNGAQYQDLHVGNGKTPTPGSAIYMHYRGYLQDGTVFDDTYKRRQWYRFTYGTNAILPALEQAMATMREGGKRRILLPPNLAYGKNGFTPPDKEGEAAIPIPPDSTLIFDITFLWMREPEYDKIRRFK
jgi:peptidylprolyl isomerase